MLYLFSDRLPSLSSGHLGFLGNYGKVMWSEQDRSKLKTLSCAINAHFMTHESVLPSRHIHRHRHGLRLCGLWEKWMSPSTNGTLKKWASCALTYAWHDSVLLGCYWYWMEQVQIKCMMIKTGEFSKKIFFFFCVLCRAVRVYKH